MSINKSPQLDIEENTVIIYKGLNNIIEYVENNLENNINYADVAKIICTNEYTMRRIFSLLSNISITEYIRNRRLSNAGYDLYKNNGKIIDIALKYQYENATSFSRAFEKFHGIKPSAAKNNPEKLRIYTRLKFNEDIDENTSIEYSIIELDEKILYGKKIKTTYYTIQKEAPNFFEDMTNKYAQKYGYPNYGIVMYESRVDSINYEYGVAYSKKIEEFEKILIPKSKWLVFKINSQEAKDIQAKSREFYEKFLPSCKFNLRPIPELEYYHDDITEFLIPIE